MSVCFQAAAALCISVGSFSDPDELPGLAHFLEHSESCDENTVASVLAVIVSIRCWPTKRKHVLLKLCCFLLCPVSSGVHGQREIPGRERL